SDDGPRAPTREPQLVWARPSPVCTRSEPCTHAERRTHMSHGHAHGARSLSQRSRSLAPHVATARVCGVVHDGSASGVRAQTVSVRSWTSHTVALSHTQSENGVTRDGIGNTCLPSGRSA